MLRRPPDLHGRRVVGVDMARCLALLGMMATHILPGYEGLEIPWPQQLAGGRASALFAVLAGVSLSLTTGREHPVHGRERIARSCGLAVRALLSRCSACTSRPSTPTWPSSSRTTVCCSCSASRARPRLSGLFGLAADGGARASRQSSAPASRLPSPRRQVAPRSNGSAIPGSCSPSCPSPGRIRCSPGLPISSPAWRSVASTSCLCERAAAAGGRLPAEHGVARVSPHHEHRHRRHRPAHDAGARAGGDPPRAYALLTHGLFGTTPTESWCG